MESTKLQASDGMKKPDVTAHLRVLPVVRFSNVLKLIIQISVPRSS